jgi:hypothetical protein
MLIRFKHLKVTLQLIFKATIWNNQSQNELFESGFFSSEYRN